MPHVVEEKADKQAGTQAVVSTSRSPVSSASAAFFIQYSDVLALGRSQRAVATGSRGFVGWTDPPLLRPPASPSRMLAERAPRHKASVWSGTASGHHTHSRRRTHCRSLDRRSTHGAVQVLHWHFQKLKMLPVSVDGRQLQSTSGSSRAAEHLLFGVLLSMVFGLRSAALVAAVRQESAANATPQLQGVLRQRKQCFTPAILQECLCQLWRASLPYTRSCAEVPVAVKSSSLCVNGTQQAVHGSCWCWATSAGPTLRLNALWGALAGFPTERERKPSFHVGSSRAVWLFTSPRGCLLDLAGVTYDL